MPEMISPAYKILLQIITQVKPEIVVSNGDEMDFSTISRFGRMGWEKNFSVMDELKTCKESLSRVVELTPTAKHVMIKSNHMDR